MEKRLRLSNWTGGQWFGKPGISFDVTEEDGSKVQKQFTATSRMLIRLLKPILIRADHEGRKVVVVRIVRTGEGQNTRYAVDEFSPGAGKR